jgi:hypothetical protein
MISGSRLQGMADVLVEVPGIRAVVLGGSRAKGTHHPDSDVDLGLYYDASTLDLTALQSAARLLGGPDAAIAGPGGWGPWVDGGAWLMIEDTPVDLILRDVDRVREQCERAARGQLAVHVQTGHPLGFVDVAYAGEVATCRPLVDLDALLPDLRAWLDPYPSALRRAFVDHLFTAEFQISGARKTVTRGDLAYVLLSCTTALLWCAQAWHAVAGVWVTNEKGLLPAVAGLPIDTHDFAPSATEALARIGRAGTDPDALASALEEVAVLVNHTIEDTRAALRHRSGGTGSRLPDRTH